MGARDGDGARRAYTGVFRGTFIAADDGKKMQSVTVRGRFGEEISDVEHWQPYGVHSVPLPPKDGSQAEALIANLGGSSDHPVVIAVADRRHRPTGAEPGETLLYDDQGQQIKIGRNGITMVGGGSNKPISITVGNSTLRVANGQITATVGGMTMTVLPGRVKIGNGSQPVKLANDAASTNLFAD